MTDPVPPTAAEIRAVFPGKLDEPKCSTELIDGLIGAFIQAVVTARGVAIWPTSATEVCHANRSGNVLLSHVPVRTITAVSWVPTGSDATVDPTVLDADALAGLRTDEQIGWVLGIGACHDADVTMAYTHGLTVAPADALWVCAEYVRKRALETTGNKPRQAVPTEDGQNFAYTVPQPDPSKGRWTGIPTVDTAISLWDDYRVGGFG